MALREFYSIVKDERGALTFMMQEGLVRRTAPQCTACQRDMSLVKAGRGDALTWRCPVDKGYKVFGAVCPVTKEGFLKVIPDTTEATILSLIERHVAPGSIIHSNRHASYDSIAALSVTPPYQHFVVAASGDASTSHVESFWQSARLSFKALAGVADTTLESHLDEFMWRNVHGKTSHDAWRNIREHIAQRYPTP